MRIQANAIGSLVVVAVRGHLTAGTDASELHCLIGQLGRSYGLRVVLDLARLGRLDCAGIGHLVQIDRNLRANQGRLRLANLDQIKLQLLELLHLNEVLVVVQSVEAALADHVRGASNDDPGRQGRQLASGAKVVPIAPRLRARSRGAGADARRQRPAEVRTLARDRGPD